MWFNDEDSALGRPHRRDDQEAADALVQALSEYRPATDQLWVPAGDELPDPGPDLRMHKTDAGAAFYCVPLVNSVPDSMLFNIAGFELGFAFTTSHEAANEASCLADQIRRKDRAGSDWLVISAGAPDKHGIVYPAEEALADFVLANGALALEMAHLRRVTLHFWSTGRAVDIWPTPRTLLGPLYQGTVPSQKQITVPTA